MQGSANKRKDVKREGVGYANNKPVGAKRTGSSKEKIKIAGSSGIPAKARSLCEGIYYYTEETKLGFA